MKIIHIIFVILILSTAGCKTNNVKGIIIGDTLKAHQSIIENRALGTLILQSLEKDKDSLVSLKNFNCGGGAGCYDLGYIITQIIFKIGEHEFIKIYQRMSEAEKSGFNGFIRAGLEYGDNNYDGKMDDIREIEQAFPSLSKIIQ